MFTNVILPILLFGILVFIHELGHFTVAKLSGVFVERFALGFGPALFRKKWRETEYAICALPLGGYVKMRGEEPEQNEEPDERSFASKPVKTRFAIVAMGPVSNLILPIILFFLLYTVGVETPSSQIGRVIPDYPAAKADLRAGDWIVAVDDQKVWKWTDMTTLVRERPGKRTKFTYERNGEQREVILTPVSEEEPNMFGEMQQVGKIGIDLQPFYPTLGISNPMSPAAWTGLKTGDIVHSINGDPVQYWWQLEEAFTQNKAGLKLEIERNHGEENAVRKTFTLSAKVKSLQAAGIASGDLFLREVRPGSVAEEKGLEPGDQLVSINGKPLKSWYEFHEAIRSNQGEQLLLGIVRNNKSINIELIPKEVTSEDLFTREKKKIRQLGVVSAAFGRDPAFQLEQYLNPFKALKRSIQETTFITVTTITGVVKLITGKLSKKTLGGPIAIFFLAGSSYKRGGWVSYFRIMAVLSITLAILNFLPIPVLDGGHLFFLTLEAIKGSPVSIKIQAMAQQLGLVIILGLMLFVFWIDIDRYFLDRIKALFN